MPWNGASFRKHNRSLSAAQADKAAAQANAVLKSTGDEGEAIAVANKHAKQSHFARGGEITEVAGKPIGKDDGIIAAQRGEFVVKKSAVKKLGVAALNEINKGRLPSERLYGSRKAVRHA